MLRWTLFVYAAIYSVFFHSFSLQPVKELLPYMLSRSGYPFRPRYSVFSSPLPFGWGCKSNALFSISKLRRNFFFFPPRLLESAPLLAFPPYLCPSLFSQSGCKSNRITLPFQIYLKLFFTPKSRPNHNYIGLQPKGGNKKMKIISEKAKMQGYKP